MPTRTSAFRPRTFLRVFVLRERLVRGSVWRRLQVIEDFSILTKIQEGGAKKLLRVMLVIKCPKALFITKTNEIRECRPIIRSKNVNACTENG